MSKISIKKRERNSNFELIRIVAMLLIIGHHFSYHGNLSYDFDSLSVNRVWNQFLLLGGKVGANTFVLISGYFLIRNKQKIGIHLLKLWIPISFYSVLFFILHIIFDKGPINMIDIIKSIMPISFETWWFASTYFVLLILSPYINILINNIEKKDYTKLIFVMTIIWSILPSLIGKKYLCNYLLWFIYLYLLGGFISKNNAFSSVKVNKICKVTIFVYLFTFLTAVLFDLIGLKYTIFAEKALHFYDIQSIFVLLISVGLLGIAASRSEKNTHFINLFGNVTFAVYLIHDNIYVRNWIWNVIFKNEMFTFSIYLIPYSLIVIVIVFLFCSVIELIRQKIINTLISTEDIYYLLIEKGKKKYGKYNK